MKSKEEHGIEWAWTWAWTEMNMSCTEFHCCLYKTITLDTWTKAVCIEMHLDRRRPGTLSLRAKPKESCCWYCWHLSWYWCWTFDLQECRSWFWHYTICFTRVFGISWFCCSFSHLLEASPMIRAAGKPKWAAEVLIIDVLCYSCRSLNRNGPTAD